MLSVNQGKLSDMANELQKEITLWRQKVGYYGDQDLQQEKQVLFAKFDELAKSSKSDFCVLLTSKTIQTSLFLEYLDATELRKSIFLANCTDEELLVYVDRRCAHLRSLRFNINEYIASHKEMADTINHLCSCVESRAGLAKKQAQEIYTQLVFTLFALNYEENTWYYGSAYCSNKLQELIKLINDVNVKDINDDTLLHHAFNSNICRSRDYMRFTKVLINRKADIRAKNKSSETPLMRAVKYLHYYIGPFDFFSFALNSKPSLDNNEWYDLLRLAIIHGNEAAISAFHANRVNDKNWNQSSVFDLMYEGKNTSPQTIQGLLYYLKLLDLEVYDMLEHLHMAGNFKEMHVAIERLASDNAYFDYEIEEKRGLFYFLAVYPEVCKKVGISVICEIGISKYFNERYAPNANGTSKKDHVDLISDLIIKSLARTSPLNAAIKRNNVQFLLLTLSIVESGANVSNDFDSKVAEAILELVEQHADVSRLITHLEMRRKSQWRPNRWFSYESKLLQAINTKLYALQTISGSKGLFWASCNQPGAEEEMRVLATNGATITVGTAENANTQQNGYELTLKRS